MLLTLLLLLPQTFTAERAPEWDAVFAQTSGWTGADGIYSIPLSSEELPNKWRVTDTLFVFSDTFWGDVDANGNRSNPVMVNNTVGFLPRGSGADPQAIQFFSGSTAAQPAAMFVPTTPSITPGEFYWLKDGITINGRTHIVAARMRTDPAPFHRYGISLITLPAGDLPPFPNQIQRETPFWKDEQGNEGQYSLGGAFLDLGAPDTIHPDGYVYVYGIREDVYNKKVIVARVLRDDFEDFSKWRVFDGTQWVSGIGNAKTLCGRTSTEMSVTQLPNGRYLMVFMKDTISGIISIRTAPSPEGPWGPIEDVYTVPPMNSLAFFTYHAKAHPHLSGRDGLLISYNVNATDFWSHFTHAEIYRPRFIRLNLQ